MTYSHTCTVRFAHVDRAGIAYFARAFEYAHEAFEELLGAAGLASVFDAEEWGMPLVHAEADYRAPMRLGDRIAVRATVAALSPRTITVAFELVGEADGRLRASVRHVHAFVELEGLRPRGAPEALLTGLRGLGLLSAEQ